VGSEPPLRGYALELFSLNAESESTAASEFDVAPTTKVVQFLVRDEVGTLSNALQIFSVSFLIYI
jgi:hypothetical protein